MIFGTARILRILASAIRETSTGSPTWRGLARRRARVSEPSHRRSGRDSCSISSRMMQVRRATSSAPPPTNSPLSPCTTCPSCRPGTATRWSSSAMPRTRPPRARVRVRPWPSRMPSFSQSVSAIAMASAQAFVTYREFAAETRRTRRRVLGARRAEQDRGSGRSLVSGSSDAARAQALRQPERSCLAVRVSHRLE